MTQYGSNSSGGRIVDQLFYGQGQYVLCQAGPMVGPALYQNVPWGHPVTNCHLSKKDGGALVAIASRKKKKKYIEV